MTSTCKYGHIYWKDSLQAAGDSFVDITSRVIGTVFHVKTQENLGEFVHIIISSNDIVIFCIYYFTEKRKNIPEQDFLETI